MSAIMTACFYLTSFIFQHAAAQYPYNPNYYPKNNPQGNYLQVKYQQGNYQEDNYPQDNYSQDNYPQFNYRQDNYPQNNYRQDIYPQDNYRQDIYLRSNYPRDNYPKESYSEIYQQDLQGPILPEYYQSQENPSYARKLHKKRSKHHKLKHQYISSTEEDSDECNCSCNKCMSPEPKPCCELVCASCVVVPDQPQPQSNQRVIMLPYPYPLIIAGIQAQTKRPIAIKLTHEEDDMIQHEIDGSNKTQNTTIRTTSIEIPTSSKTPITFTVPPSTDKTTLNIFDVEQFTPNIRNGVDVLKMHDANTDYNVPKSIFRRMKHNAHRYAIVPITDELQANLMLELRKTKPYSSVVRNAYKY